MARRARATETLTQVLAAFTAKRLLPDLKKRAKLPAVHAALQAEHVAERQRGTTAQAYIAWRDAWLEQVAAAWVLSCVYVRTLEDRELLGHEGAPAPRRLAGAGADGNRAEDSEARFFRLFPRLGVRDYLRAAFREVANLPGGGDLLGPSHNPAWKLAPSAELCRELLAVFRAPDPDDPSRPRWRFDVASCQGSDAPGDAAPRFHSDTRFLGDLYQDLSEPVRKRYALLQTPDFVETFILDRTLEPAIDTFGLDGLRVLDPACGSGHFLLGSFARLLDHWQRKAPGLSATERANRALASIHGIDLNPYAVAISRFRLTLAWLEATGTRRLANAPDLKMNLAVGDALLAGRVQGEFAAVAADAGFGRPSLHLDDSEHAGRLLALRYHAVVANPPYITVKDKAPREAIRAAFQSAAGKYALSVPFAEQILRLGVSGGYSGQITANSFMKREFGRTLVEEVLPKWELTHVIDTSGAYIPGHGTPTVILFAKAQRPTSSNLIAVQGRRGEPGVPADPAKGKVWRSIVRGLCAPDARTAVRFENSYVTVQRKSRPDLAGHPWSLKGGGADSLKTKLEQSCRISLSGIATTGVGGMSNADDVFLAEHQVLLRKGIERRWIRELVIGEDIRDWRHETVLAMFFPYKADDLELAHLRTEWLPALWPYRTTLWARATFSGGTYRSEGKAWHAWHQLTQSRYSTPLSIPFAFVATHNHFVLDRGGKVHKQTAPVIKLPAHAKMDEHLTLLGLLNSSPACFWMRQVCQRKDGSRDEWEQRYEFDSTKLGRFPLPEDAVSLLGQATALDALARAQGSDSVAITLSQHAGTGVEPLGQALKRRRSRQHARLMAMVALQEELDWTAYGVYGVLDDVSNRADISGVVPGNEDVSVLVAAAETGESDAGTLAALVAPTSPAPLRPGHRTFEIRLAHADAEARAAEAAGQESEQPPTAWFERHGWAAETDTCAIQDTATRARVEARLEAIEGSRALRLLEAPEHKRRWYAPDFDAEERDGCERFLADKLEAWAKAQPRVVSVREASHALAGDAEVVAVAALLDDNDVGLEALLVQRLMAEAVPFLAALRFKPAGMEKHLAWREVWALQRREDAGEEVGEIPVPPRYATADYRNGTFWSLRGKLDVPKERFISYPGLDSPEDPTPRFGWAGWNHAERARALAGLIGQVRRQGASEAVVVPLVAGLDELMPWLQQWHGEPDDSFRGQVPVAEIQRFLDAELRRLGVARDTLAEVAR